MKIDWFLNLTQNEFESAEVKLSNYFSLKNFPTQKIRESTYTALLS